MRRGRRFGLLMVLAVLAGLAATLPASVSEAAPGSGPVLAQGSGSQPNFVVVVTDDQRWDTIGRCLPTFDGSDYSSGADSCMPQVAQKLIANGVTFLKGEVHQSLCCPSRASILTGQYSRHTGVKTLAGSDFDDSSSLATWLDDAGYRTGLFGKYLNGYGQATLANYIPPGWDSFHSFHGYRASTDNPYIDYPWIDWEEGDAAGVVTRHNDADSTSTAACAVGNLYSTDLICRQAKDFLATQTTTPFLLYLAPASPHSPNTVATRHIGAYGGIAMPQYPSHNVIPTPNPPAYLPATPLSDTTMVRYREGHRKALQSNLAADDMVGQVYDQLSTDGRLNNTVWMFISDNGGGTGEHRLSGKQCPYIECHRVPFIVVCPTSICPGAGAGVRDADNYALNIDIAPTIAELAGVTPTLRVDGRSLVPILTNPTAPWRTEWALYDNQEPVDGVVATSTDGSWYKYLVLPNTGETQLFNLDNDPWELTNLWDNTAYSAVQTDMAAKLTDSLNNPTLTITSQPPASGSGSTATISYSSNETVTFECGLDGAVPVACGTGTTGSVTYDGLAATTHTVTVTAVDRFGNASPTSTISFTLTGGGGGTGPAQPTLTQTPTDPSGSTVTFSFTGTGEVTFECTLDGVAATCTSPVTYTALADGDHTFSVVAIDQDGVRSTPASYTWTVSEDGATTFDLTVTRAGTGSGTVRSTPAGIKCGTDCTESYASGTSVTLTANV
ncbi:MAG: sulfatase family protein, partial [Acidimicrobiia bacterium]